MNEKDHKADFSFITGILEENRKAGYEHGYSVGYNEAIDDFKGTFIKRIEKYKRKGIAEHSNTAIKVEVLRIAEQLKGAKQNED